MPCYKLYYFNARGRAEPARLMFAAAGIEYEDIRFNREEWLKQKEELAPPFKKAPMLTVDGKKIAQSMAIMKFVARKSGFCPCKDIEIAECDSIVDEDNDFTNERVKWYFEKDEAKKKELGEEIVKTHRPNFLDALQRFIKDNETKSGYLVGCKMTYADVLIFNTIDGLLMHEANVLNGYPDLKAHYELVKSNAGIAAWLDKRPKTEM